MYPNVCSSRREAAWEHLLFSYPFSTLPLCSHGGWEEYSFRVNPSLRLAIGGTKGEAKESFTHMKKEWSHQVLLNFFCCFRSYGNRIMIEQKNYGSYLGI